MPGLSVFIVALLIPLIVVAGNGFVRWLFGSPQSAAADLILAMMVFDATVSIQSHDFSPFVTAEFLKSNLAAIYMSLLFVSFFVWMATAFKLEPNLLSGFDFEEKHYSESPRKLIFYSYLISVFALLMNVLPFAYGKH